MAYRAQQKPFLRAVLAFLFASIFSVIVFLFVPVTGVRTDVVVMMRDSASFAHAEQIVENAVVIAQSAIRDASDMTDIKKTHSERIGAAGAFYVVTYGHDRDELAGAHNKAMRSVLMRELSYFENFDAIYFEKVGSSYVVTRWFMAVCVLLLASILGTFFATVLTSSVRTRDRDEDAFSEEQKKRYAELFERMKKTRTGEMMQRTDNDKAPHYTHQIAEQSQEVAYEDLPKVYDSDGRDAYSKIVDIDDEDRVQSQELEESDTQKDAEDTPAYDKKVSHVKQEKENVEGIEEQEAQNPVQTISLPTLKDAPHKHRNSKSFLSQRKNAVEFGKNYEAERLSDPLDQDEANAPKEEKSLSVTSTNIAHVAPGNLPVVDASDFYGADAEVKESHDEGEMHGDKVSHDDSEPTDDELKERLNQLLRGEL